MTILIYGGSFLLIGAVLVYSVRGEERLLKPKETPVNCPTCKRPL